MHYEFLAKSFFLKSIHRSREDLLLKNQKNFKVRGIAKAHLTHYCYNGQSIIQWTELIQ